MDKNERSFEEQKLLYYTALMMRPPIIDLHRLIEERCARAIEGNLEAVTELNKKVLEILMIPATIHTKAIMETEASINHSTPPDAKHLLGVVFCSECKTRIETYNPDHMKWIELIDTDTETYLCGSECRITMERREEGF